MSDPQLFVFGKRRGRPYRAGELADGRLWLRVTKSERQALDAVQVAEQRPMAKIIRDAVNEYVADFQDKVVFTPSGDKFPKR